MELQSVATDLFVQLSVTTPAVSQQFWECWDSDGGHQWGRLVGRNGYRHSACNGQQCYKFRNSKTGHDVSDRYSIIPWGTSSNDHVNVRQNRYAVIEFANFCHGTNGWERWELLVVCEFTGVESVPGFLGFVFESAAAPHK